jgi:hypothetical protein
MVGGFKDGLRAILLCLGLNLKIIGRFSVDRPMGLLFGGKNLHHLKVFILV